MSSENEDGRSMYKGSDNSDTVIMKPKISYSREFLLSLSNLDFCKKLPTGFDESLISEFEDALIGTPDNRPRAQGSLPFQGFRRNEYGASPPTRGDAGNYSRANYGKWESRSSGRSDRDSDSQSEKDSDSGRRFGHQARRPWQTSEHDGLLGSGSNPRPSGYAAGISAPKLRANEHNQLSRGSEPYHPPRPYKAVPHSKRETLSDSFNDETFGSMECSSEDRAEAERRRRASFETMRKEQQKALQEKQKSNPEKQKAGALSDFYEVLVDSKEEKHNELEVSAVTPILNNDLDKSSFASHSPASRPLVPPGFKSNTLEKSSGSKSLIHPPLSEAVKPVTGDSLVDADAYFVPSTNGALERRLSQEIGVGSGQPSEKTHPALLLNKGETNVNVHVSLDAPSKRPGTEDQLLQVSTLSNPEIAEFDAGVLVDKTAPDSIRNSTSLLEKILGSTLTVGDTQLNSVEHSDSKPDDTWSPNSVQSSKFAQWFFEDEAKVDADVTSSMPNDLLSLIVSGDKVGVVSDQVCINNKEEATPAILTCEDLEQSILSEYTAKTTKPHPVVEVSSASGANSEQPIDNHASLHLLSMLQKNTEQSNTNVNSVININFADKPIVSQEYNIATVFNKPKEEENGKNLPNMGSTLTLETLFGTAFMKELKSVEAPVSVKRGSIGSARVDTPESLGLPFPVTDNGLPNHDYSVSSNHTQRTKASETENWLGFDKFPIEASSSKGVEFQLPAEENLISVGDSRDHRMLTFMPTSNSINHNVNLSSNAPINVSDKLATFGIKGEQSMSKNLPFSFDSYEQMGPAISNRNMPAPQMPQVRPLYNPLEPHPSRMSPQLKFVGPGPIFNQDSSNMIRPPFHQPNVRVAGFDVPTQLPAMHQMQMPGNHPPPYSRGFPHNGDHSTGFIQEMNQMQGFPFGPRQPNIGSHGMPMPPGNPPEAFQRLMEMELRANPKQIHPLAPGHNQEMHGYEVDMGFRYR